MIPTTAIFRRAVDLLASDTVTLGITTPPNKIMLIADAFAPLPGLTIGDLTPATFNGSAPKAATGGPCPTGQNPVTGQYELQVPPPSGGFRFECAVAPGSPETIYGWAYINDDSTTLYGTDVLDTPVVITNVNDFVEIDAADFRYSPSGVS